MSPSKTAEMATGGNGRSLDVNPFGGAELFAERQVEKLDYETARRESDGSQVKFQC